MSEKHYKWKDIGKPPQRLNAFLTPSKEIPAKFAPNRDRSQSVDKLFNTSRSRLHSSVEMQALNHTREDSFREKIQPREESKKKDEVDRKTTLNKFPTLSLMMQQSSITAQNRHSALIINELKKEFWAFKQNVLRELQRQKELVLKFVKEIVLTMEVQMQKLANLKVEEKVEMKKVLSINDNIQAKSLEDWKASLTNIRLACTAPATSFPKPNDYPQNPVKAATSSTKFGTAQPGKEQTHLPPPSLPLDVGAFLSSISKLRMQFNEMDKILENGENKKGVKS